MTALALTDDGLALQTNVQTPTITAKDALIRVTMAGVCATDLQLIQGYKGGYRGILGHEFVGEVIQAPAAPEMVGERVVGEINIGCGDCPLCERGLGKHCRNRKSMGIINYHGAFATYAVLPLRNLRTVPSTISNQEAVFTEPLAAALEILEQVTIHPSARVYLIGDGRLGLLIAQVLATTNADLTVVGRHSAKLSLLASKGIRTVVSNEEALSELVQLPADITVEATGTESGFQTARRLVRPQGTIVLKSTFAGGLSNFDISSLVVDEISLVGSRCGPFDAALRMLAQKRVDVTSLISAVYPLKDSVEALHYAGQKGVLKVLIEP